MNVTLVTTWQMPCGIAEYASYLVGAWPWYREPGPDALPAVRVAVQHLRDLQGFEIESSLHPDAILSRGPRTGPRVLHLNYHAALHSQWTPTTVLEAKTLGWRVLVTYHDSGVPNTDQCKALHAVADAFVVHEPVDDLPGAYYWRQGIPALEDPLDLDADRDWPGQPLVGTVGFPFPWKNYDLLVEAAREAGWKAVLIAPNATGEQITRWRNQWAVVYPTFLPTLRVGAILAGCDATAFLYSCANAGTSGAIRQGLATRKTVIAADGCRQFRDLTEDMAGVGGILWTGLDRPSLVRTFTKVHLGINPGVVYLAHRDSWQQLAMRYDALYQELSA